MEKEKTKKNGELIKRLVTSAVIVLSVAGAFVLRQIPSLLKDRSPYDAETGKRIFDIMFYVFSLVSTYELLRAIKGKINFFEKVVVAVLAVLFVPVLAFLGLKAGLVMICVAVGLVFCDFVFSYKIKTMESAGYALVAICYPTILLAAPHYINHRIGFIPLLLLFVVSSFSDSGAYIVGSLVKGRKLCPEISPKKTVSGAIGGLIAGIIGALIVFIFVRGRMASLGTWLGIAIMITAGLFGSVATQFGDLVESEIKRKLGVKDFGNIIVGHGGMLDRIDGFLFNAVFIALFFSFIEIIL